VSDPDGKRARWELPVLGAVGLLLVALLVWAMRGPEVAPSQELSTLGAIEVTARLTAILSEFPKNDLYDYVYIMKYTVMEVHRGSVAGKEILVGHYNPLKPRSHAQDEFVETVSGNLEKFRAGEVHRMALDGPLDERYMGGIIDKYHGEEGARYWAFCTDRVSE